MRISRVIIDSVQDKVSTDLPQKLFSGAGILNEELVDRSYWGMPGLTNIPPADTVGVMLSDGGTCNVIAAETIDRPALSNAGDTAVYSSSTIFIKVLASGLIQIDNGVGKIEINATTGQVSINDGNLTVDA
jgi:hypothetical protein